MPIEDQPTPSVRRRKSEEKILTMMGAESFEAAHASVTNNAEAMAAIKAKDDKRRSSVDKIAATMGGMCDKFRPHAPLHLPPFTCTFCLPHSPLTAASRR